MAISAISSLSNIASNAAGVNASANSNASQSKALQLDFTTYLKILVTQLKNQDPTNATDPNQFTQELIQMQQVQAQITNNQDLEGLVKASSANSLAMGVGYIGSYVRANTSKGDFALQNGAAEIGYTLPQTAAGTTITIEDSNGKNVATITGGATAGDNYVLWNGAKNDGTTAADGAYTFTVQAVDSGGATIASSNPTALFRVTGVQSNSDGTLTLDAGSLSLLSTDITGVYSGATVPNATPGNVVTSNNSNNNSGNG